MAITSYGYPDLIPPGAAFALMQMTLGRQYMAQSATGCAVSKVAGGTRQTRVAPGYLGGKGILDYSDANVTQNHDVVASGTRYDAVVLRRWIDNTAVDPDVPFRSEFKIVKGTAARAIPLLTQNPGTLDDQALALVGHRAGETEAFEIVDLRCIAEEPGVYTVFDDLALQLIKRPGITAYNAVTGITRRCVFDKNLTLQWQIVDKAVGNLYAAGAWRDAGSSFWGSPYYTHIASIDIPDPGYPYFVDAYGRFEYGRSSGTYRYDFAMVVGGTLNGSRVDNPGTTLALTVDIPTAAGFKVVDTGVPRGSNAANTPFTGPTTLRIVGYQGGGSGSAAGSYITAHNRRFDARVIPAY